VNVKAAEDRNHASVAEVVGCFNDERPILSRLALLITGDQATAEQSVVDACEMTVKGHSPFRDWLLEWAKAATITSAISKCAAAIRHCEAAYREQHCSHAEHTSQGNAEERAASLNLILEADARKVIAELDPLSRAVLVLRLGIRSSIQDCVLRLNVARAAVLAANCRAMTWLHGLQLQAVPAEQPASSANGRHNEAHPSPGRDLRNGSIYSQWPAEALGSGSES
jgi:DNA-directed RNA polymerase specialized sigma24 family protein